MNSVTSLLFLAFLCANALAQSISPSPLTSSSVVPSPSPSSAVAAQSPPPTNSASNAPSPSSSPPSLSNSALSISPSPSPASEAPSPSANAPSPSPSMSQSLAIPAPIPFSDFTFRAGLRQQISEQFGGPTIADLDGDGLYDLVLTYHNRSPMRVYFGLPGGKFQRSSFVLKADIHGVSVAQRDTSNKERLMTLSVGGGRGTNLRVPRVFSVYKNRTIDDISFQYGFGVNETRTRGRVAVFMDLSMKTRFQQRRNGGGPDVLFINLLGSNLGLTHFAYENVMGSYELRDIPDFQRVNEERAIVTDIDNDMQMELVHFSLLRFFKLTAPFQLTDITEQVRPPIRALRRSISAITEVDYNNDGRMDLYIARARAMLVTPRGPATVMDTDDILLKNVGGKYVDVSTEALIPTGTDSMGVSAADFDNDGYVDIIITTFFGPDIILMNQGGKTFKVIDPKTTKADTTRGSNVMAFDYDQDGRVDYIEGQGWKKAFLGNYRLMKNMMQMTSDTHYLHVRVGNEFTDACTSLNAIVIVYMPRRKRMIRRVGGRGAQSGGQSYLDTVHFGLGSVTMVNRVRVRWTVGTSRILRSVKADQLVSVGKFK